MSDSSENSGFGLRRKSELPASDAMALAAMDIGEQRAVVAREIMPAHGGSWGHVAPAREAGVESKPELNQA